ncbi:sensor histidine kinase [Lusitaniella coriacea]|uniref:sensor histidine kinase n=1 Tax=Lusitaniella coriacea TaxID=1983105 RepID=UPI003CF4BE93
MRYLTARNHPLRFLLYIEWSMLLVIVIGEVLRIWFFRGSRYPFHHLWILVIFGVMGLVLPAKNNAQKIIYTGFEFWLIQLISIGRGLRLFSLMYIILVARNCFIFERLPRSFVTGLAYFFFLIEQFERFQYRRHPPFMPPERAIFMGVTSVIFFGLVLLFLQLSIAAILAERKSREKLALANAQLRDYALRIEDVATLQERNRIAREIHDSLGHSLTVFNLHLEAALRLLSSDPQEAKALLLEAKQQGSKALKEVRQSVATLRSDPLQGKSLTDAIALLIEDVQRSTGITPQTQILLSSPLPKELKMAVYRILQESLTNTCKYAEATEVKIQIHLTATALKLQVRDNGKGFTLEKNTTGFGLQGMQERTKALGGQLKIVTAPGKGCHIFVELPFRSNLGV